jgi:hypothetical protein
MFRFPEISMSKSEFQFRFQHWNFDSGYDFDLGIPVSTSEFRLSKSKFRLSKFQFRFLIQIMNEDFLCATGRVPVLFGSCIAATNVPEC